MQAHIGVPHLGGDVSGVGLANPSKKGSAIMEPSGTTPPLHPLSLRDEWFLDSEERGQFLTALLTDPSLARSVIEAGEATEYDALWSTLRILTTEIAVIGLAQQEIFNTATDEGNDLEGNR